MKSITLNLSLLASAATLLCGCGDSKSTPPVQAANNPPAAPAQQATPAATATPAPASTAPATAVPVPAAASAPAPSASPAAVPAPPTEPVAPALAGGDAASAFVASAKAQSDPTLASLGNELADKTKALTQAAPADDVVKTQIATSMKSLSAGNDATGLSGLLQTAKSANLTPQQTQLAKEVGNLASAYVVQKNFSSLDGAQTDVATIVNSLRKGEVTTALPALQKVAGNASLTPSQKQLVSSLADHYAPGLSKATDTLQQGLKGLDNLRGTGK